MPAFAKATAGTASEGLKSKDVLRVKGAKAVRQSFSVGGLIPIMFFYVYMIRSIIFPDEKYIGLTDNLKERLETHNSGGSVYTAKNRPWKLVMFMGFSDKFKAASFERYLKSGSGRAFAQKRFW